MINTNILQLCIYDTLFAVLHLNCTALNQSELSYFSKFIIFCILHLDHL